MNRPLPRSISSTKDDKKINDKKIIILTKKGLGNKKKLTSSLKEEWSSSQFKGIPNKIGRDSLKSRRKLMSIPFPLPFENM